MTYDEVKEFTKKVVLKYLQRIVAAEEQGKRVENEVEELREIAYGLNMLTCITYLSILKETYQIPISL